MKQAYRYRSIIVAYFYLDRIATFWEEHPELAMTVILGLSAFL